MQTMRPATRVSGCGAAAARHYLQGRPRGCKIGFSDQKLTACAGTAGFEARVWSTPVIAVRNPRRFARACGTGDSGFCGPELLELRDFFGLPTVPRAAAVLTKPAHPMAESRPVLSPRLACLTPMRSSMER